MRLRFLLLVIISTACRAAADPVIRWVDKTGTVRSARIAAVKSESTLEIKVEQADGKTLTVPTRDLLTLIREDDTDPDERALLHARGSAYLGYDTADGIATCDRLIKSGKHAWIKEYAEAHRALLAVRTSEKDAKKRVLGFMEKYSSSRFKAWMIFALAQLHSRESKKGAEVVDALELAFDDVRHCKGPLVVAFDCLVERGRMYAFGDWRAVGSFAQNVRARFEKELDSKDPDAGLSLVIESAIIRIGMVWNEQRYVALVPDGLKPYASRDNVEALRRKSKYLLPELRSDVAFLLGRIYQACGDTDKAKAAFAEAVKLAPDPWRRALAARR